MSTYCQGCSQCNQGAIKSPPPACPPYESRTNYNVEGAPMYKGCAAAGGVAYYDGWGSGGEITGAVTKGLTLEACVALCASTAGCVQVAFVKELSGEATSGCARKEWNPEWMTTDANVLTVAGIDCPLPLGARCTAESGSTNCGPEGFCNEAGVCEARPAGWIYPPFVHGSWLAAQAGEYCVEDYNTISWYGNVGNFSCEVNGRASVMSFDTADAVQQVSGCRVGGTSAFDRSGLNVQLAAFFPDSTGGTSLWCTHYNQQAPGMPLHKTNLDGPAPANRSALSTESIYQHCETMSYKAMAGLVGYDQTGPDAVYSFYQITFECREDFNCGPYRC